MSFLADRRSALLADEMGLGKTVQAIVALRRAVADGARKILVVCPASLRLNWQQEFAAWAPEIVVRPVVGDQTDRLAYYQMPIRVLIASYEQIRADYKRLISTPVSFDVVILDEAQRIKNAGSETHLACCLLPSQTAWALTGTPLENRPDDLISVFNYLSRGLVRRGMPREELHQRIKPHFLRRRKAEVAVELPPIIIQDLPLEMGALQRQAYDDQWEQRASGAARGDGGLLAAITRLKQTCNFDPLSGQSVKLDALMTTVDGLSEVADKLLVFSQYVETLEWMRDQLDDVDVSIYHGGLSDGTRNAVLQRFRELPGPRLMLMSLRAGGVGLNIPEASMVVMFDRWWNPAVEDQAIQRAHRLGRDAPLHVLRFTISASIEERIVNVLHDKRELFEEYVDRAPQADLDVASVGLLRQLLELPDPGEFDRPTDGEIGGRHG